MEGRARHALEDMRDHAAEAIEHLGDRDLPAFSADLKTMRAVERCVEIVGEAAARVPAGVQERIDVPWSKIRGQRNRLAHQYGAIEVPILHVTVQGDYPPLVAALDAVLEES